MDIARKKKKKPLPQRLQTSVQQPDLVSGVPARCGGVGLDDL